MKTVFLTLAIVFFVVAAQAQQQTAIRLEGRLLGPSLENSYRIGPNFGLRGISESSHNFDNAPLLGTTNIGLLAVIYVGDVRRVTAGGFVPSFGTDLGTVADIAVEAVTFSNVNGTGTIDRISPVVAIGYEKIFGNNWGVSAGFGATYTGELSLVAPKRSAQVPPANLESKLSIPNAELGQIAILPFVNLSVSFAF